MTCNSETFLGVSESSSKNADAQQIPNNSDRYLDLMRISLFESRWCFCCGSFWVFESTQRTQSPSW